MKKTYTRKQITEAIAYWKKRLLTEETNAKPLRIVDLNWLDLEGREDHGEAVASLWEKIERILIDFDIVAIEVDDCEFNDAKLKYPIDASVENDGIGAYEYWGQQCYDKGDPYLEFQDIAFDEKQLNEKLAKEFGIELEFGTDDHTEIDYDEQFDSCPTETGRVKIWVVDEQQFKKALGLKDINESSIWNGKFNRVSKVIDGLQEQADSQKTFVKLVLNGHLYDIKDIYKIEDDDTDADYICIEARKNS